MTAFRSTALLLFVMLAACATPEQTLHNGYKAASATVQSTTVLFNRGAISSTEAARVEALGRTAKEGLDAGKNQLVLCRTNPGVPCASATANINLGASVLNELETYLKAKEGK